MHIKEQLKNSERRTAKEELQSLYCSSAIKEKLIVFVYSSEYVSFYSFGNKSDCAKK